MTRFFDMFSGIGGFRAGLIHTLKAAHEAAVAMTEAKKEAAT